MKFSITTTRRPMVACLRLFAVAVICAFSADAVASDISATDQPQAVPIQAYDMIGSVVVQ